MSVSTLDPTGVDGAKPEDDVAAEAIAGSGPTPVTEFTQGTSFDELAESTGGTVVHGRNDLDNLVRHAADASDELYSLSYSPTNTSEDAAEYRHIRVVMKDPALKAITRTGYFAGTPEEPAIVPADPRTQTREFRYDLLSAARSRLVYTGLQLNVKQVPNGYNIQVEARDLQWKSSVANKREAEVSIIAVAFDSKGRVLKQEGQEFREQINDADPINGVRVGFLLPIKLPANAKRMRFVMRDSTTGSMGSMDIVP